MNNHKITNLATPTADTDAATKGYVDTSAGSSFCYTMGWCTSTSPDCSAKCSCPAGYTKFTKSSNNANVIGCSSSTYTKACHCCCHSGGSFNYTAAWCTQSTIDCAANCTCPSGYTATAAASQGAFLETCSSPAYVKACHCSCSK